VQHRRARSALPPCRADWFRGAVEEMISFK
jgi:hypothetical protein